MGTRSNVWGASGLPCWSRPSRASRPRPHNPKLLQSKACNPGVPRAALHRLTLVQEELPGGHRTKLERSHGRQFLLQALKYRVRTVAGAPLRRAGPAATGQSEVRTELMFFSWNAQDSRSIIHQL